MWDVEKSSIVIPNQKSKCVDISLLNSGRQIGTYFIS